MKTVVRKWGNSLAVRLPQEVAARVGIFEGSPVAFTPKAQRLILEPLRLIPRRRRVALSSLVQKITKRNQHGLVSWNAPVGREVW